MKINWTSAFIGAVAALVLLPMASRVLSKGN